MSQAGAVMAGDAMEEDRLPAGISQQVGGLGHLLERRPRSPHRHDDPAHARFGNDLACPTYLGSSRLIAVKVTIVLIRSRAMIARNDSGSCQAPRTRHPGRTTRTRFSAGRFQRERDPQANARITARAAPALHLSPIGRITRIELAKRNQQAPPWKPLLRLGLGPGRILADSRFVATPT